MPTYNVVCQPITREGIQTGVNKIEIQGLNVVNTTYTEVASGLSSMGLACVKRKQVQEAEEMSRPAV